MDRRLRKVSWFVGVAACLASFALAKASFAGGDPSLAQSPLWADASSPVLFAQAQAGPPGAAPAPPPPKKASPADRVETRIQDLHRNLKITPAQETQWRDFAQVMRDNEKAIDVILKERAANISKMNAIDDLRSYEKLADAHAEGLKKLVPAFEALYNTMSDEQKKNADAVFGKFEKRPSHGKG
ncbi:MAG TPA: Spy/CpxP family protein refolding chaperone [Myxococcota bacterium]|nr:Spy/CpxP family protein refolding chaperone [Myxococcota bacterium]